MKYQTINSWQFIHPDFDDLGSGSGIQIAPNGKVAMVNQKAAIRQSILLLISTMPGERVMRPQYGCNLQQLVFMLNDATTHGLAIHYVRSALEQWEPRIDILYLDAEVSRDDSSIMNIILEYRIRHLHQTDQLGIAYHLMGAEI
ncbi:MAG: GPW/gp25 family protein [Methylococcaceae bacterium]